MALLTARTFRIEMTWGMIVLERIMQACVGRGRHRREAET